MTASLCLEDKYCDAQTVRDAQYIQRVGLPHKLLQNQMRL